MDIATHTQPHFDDMSPSSRLLTPSRARRPSCRISDDSDNPLQDALENQIATSDFQMLINRVNSIANLRGKRSSSSQTIERAFWREIETQVFLPVEETINTTRDAGSNTLRLFGKGTVAI